MIPVLKDARGTPGHCKRGGDLSKKAEHWGEFLDDPAKEHVFEDETAERGIRKERRNSEATLRRSVVASRPRYFGKQKQSQGGAAPQPPVSRTGRDSRRESSGARTVSSRESGSKKMGGSVSGPFAKAGKRRNHETPGPLRGETHNPIRELRETARKKGGPNSKKLAKSTGHRRERHSMLWEKLKMNVRGKLRQQTTKHSKKPAHRLRGERLSYGPAEFF